jgi:hypothetical protein
MEREWGGLEGVTFDPPSQPKRASSLWPYSLPALSPILWQPGGQIKSHGSSSSLPPSASHGFPLLFDHPQQSLPLTHIFASLPFLFSTGNQQQQEQKKSPPSKKNGKRLGTAYLIADEIKFH